MEMKELLKFTIQQKASDLHISAELPPMIRIDGDIKKVNVPSLSNDKILSMLKDIMSAEQMNIFEQEWELDFSITIPNLSRFRANVFRHNNGSGAAFRIIPEKILTLDELGLGNIFKNISMLPQGLCLVTGPTGSGKSTTLAAMINHINTIKQNHIITIEDPIEFIHKSKKSLINQREIHRDSKSFNQALRSALREDPDVILVGEMRDLETIRLAITAAETGHMVFATLHTNSAPKTIDRIVDIFPAAEKSMIRSTLSESLRAVISQVLLKKKGGGRVAAHEIMLSCPAIRNLIREDKVAQMRSTIQTNHAMGMKTLDQSLKELLSKKLISADDARLYQHSNDQM